MLNLFPASGPGLELDLGNVLAIYVSQDAPTGIEMELESSGEPVTK